MSAEIFVKCPECAKLYMEPHFNCPEHDPRFRKGEDKANVTDAGRFAKGSDAFEHVFKKGGYQYSPGNKANARGWFVHGYNSAASARDTLIAQLREALEMVASPLQIDGENHMAAVKLARSALAAAAQARKGEKW